jgi:DNA-binding MarR family transcriptional regulator
MDKVTVSRAVKRLLERGLIKRSTMGADRRCMHLELTQEGGHKTLQSIIPRAREYERALLAEMSDADIQAMENMLMRLQSAADRLEKSA